jgi:hypothetical protein
LYWGLLTQPGNPDGTLPTGDVDIYDQSLYEKNYSYLFNEKGQFVAPKHILQKNVSVSVPLSEQYKLGDGVIEKWMKWGVYEL